MSGEEYSDEIHLLRSSNDGNGAVLAVNDGAVDGDLEAQEGLVSRKSSTSPCRGGSGGGGVGAFKDLILKHLDGAGGLSGRRNSFKRLEGNRESNRRRLSVDQLRHSSNNHDSSSSARVDENDAC